MDILQLRVVERALAIIIGGISIYLGYRLFIQLPTQKDSTGKLTLPGNISVYFSRVGPGVFFCLFGAAILIVSLQHGIDLDLTSTASVSTSPPGADTHLRIRYMGGDTDAATPDRRDALRAEARRTIAELNKFPAMLASDVPASRRTDVTLAVRDSKVALIRMVWGDDWGDFARFRNWVDDGETDPVPPGVLPEVARDFRRTRQ